MARRPPESCMFCGHSPCDCEPKKKKSTAKAKPVQQDPPISPVSDMDFGPIPVEPVRRFKVEETQERDLSFINALRTLRDIVSERDKAWIDRKIAPPFDQGLDRRISEWKARNGIEKTGN